MPREERTFSLVEPALPEELFFELGFDRLRDEAGPWLKEHETRLREVTGRHSSNEPAAKRVVVIRASHNIYLSELAMRVARGEGMWTKSVRVCSLAEIDLRAKVVIGDAVDEQALRARR